jgi:hypothetical protein
MAGPGCCPTVGWRRPPAVPVHTGWAGVRVSVPCTLTARPASRTLSTSASAAKNMTGRYRACGCGTPRPAGQSSCCSASHPGAAPGGRDRRYRTSHSRAGCCSARPPAIATRCAPPPIAVTAAPERVRDSTRSIASSHRSAARSPGPASAATHRAREVSRRSPPDANGHMDPVVRPVGAQDPDAPGAGRDYLIPGKPQRPDGRNRYVREEVRE